jgi:hypothetical protein
MTSGTTEISVDRQSGIEEEQAAKIDTLRRNRRVRRRHVPRRRLKQSLSLLEHLSVVMPRFNAFCTATNWQRSAKSNIGAGRQG